jgi:ABC-type phosphate transport system permease subunit
MYIHTCLSRNEKKRALEKSIFQKFCLVLCIHTYIYIISIYIEIQIHVCIHIYRYLFIYLFRNEKKRALEESIFQKFCEAEGLENAQEETGIYILIYMYVCECIYISVCICIYIHIYSCENMFIRHILVYYL